MKVLLVIIFLSISAFLNLWKAQSSLEILSNKNPVCDSIIFKNGEVVTCQIREIQKKKVIYFLCCPQCQVPREFYLKEIDTIIRSKSLKLEGESLAAINENIQESQMEIVLDSLTNSDNTHLNIQILMLRKKNRTKKNEIIVEGQRLRIYLKDGNRLNGKLNFSPDKQILIGNQIIELEDIVYLTKSSKGWRIAGGLSGSAATLTTLWLSSLSLPVVFIPVSATLFGLMIINRKYDLTEKYEIYHLY